MSHPKTPHVVNARYMEPPGPFEATGYDAKKMADLARDVLDGKE
jgi:hypothetical protein